MVTVARLIQAQEEMDWAAGAGISAAFLGTMEGAIPAAPWEEFARQPESVYFADTQHDIPYGTIRRRWPPSAFAASWPYRCSI